MNDTAATYHINVLLVKTQLCKTIRNCIARCSCCIPSITLWPTCVAFPQFWYSLSITHFDRPRSYGGSAALDGLRVIRFWTFWRVLNQLDSLFGIRSSSFVLESSVNPTSMLILWIAAFSATLWCVLDSEWRGWKWITHIDLVLSKATLGSLLSCC